jgi:polyisoprenoid-binding protein YceI
MKSALKALAWMTLGGAMGVGATFALREATRTPIPAIVFASPPSPEPPPPAEPAPPPDTLPTPVEAGKTEPPAPPPAPLHRPPAFDFLGFPVESAERAAPAPAEPPPAPVAPKLLRFAPLPDRCVAGFDATSTLHDFRGWTKSVTGWIAFEKERLEETAAAAFVVDARTLDTNNPDRDRDMHIDVLHTARYPEFKFTLKEFRRTSKDRDDGACTMKGTMEIHGTAKDVEIPGTFALRRDGYLHVKGELRTNVTDFGISPPVTALVIRVDDEIKVWFEVWARRKEDKP